MGITGASAMRHVEIRESDGCACVRVGAGVRRGTRRRREIMRSERLKVWKCPVCGDTYADYPGYNEHEICEECGVPYRFEGWRQELD